ncbi:MULTISPECIES: aspartate kinase [unclassified Caloramator]|uniref:aspartate kinase n=1 Tax=unclassified Caloramator TaxID=2629145 RepID=UPI00237EA544|nr:MULTISPECIES: aspartate kinase [unclassified Caloramator]MDO6355464.1 aspartate kinase [Caloramator sp. CAR-1]WDU84023.1 aspartate kinase [Caloramator sp. Dgby_cultured_2]
MKIVVQKFGGTSVATQQRREMVADRIIDAIDRGYKPVVVVSAIGRKGDPYATDTLLSLINNGNCSISKREVDLLLCCGEIISAVVMAETLEKRGYNVTVLTGGQAGIITNNDFGNAEVLKVETKKIMDLLYSGAIPIVTGFQGMTQEGDFTTLGRGGSDVTGAILGEALKAEFIEIYTDVDGIMTADPRIVPDAKVINRISYNEVFQFADQGAKVIHPKAVEYAMRGNIPLYIKNTLSNAPGTIITSSRESRNKIITGITHMSNRSQVSVHFNEDDSNEIFDILADNKISIDLINVFPKYKVFTVDTKDIYKVEEILKELKLEYNIINNCSKIAVIGNGMKGVPGVMAKILKTLNENGIKVLQTADSHSTIWCLVKDEDTIKAINLLHKAFEL